MMPGMSYNDNEGSEDLFEVSQEESENNEFQAEKMAVVSFLDWEELEDVGFDSVEKLEMCCMCGLVLRLEAKNGKNAWTNCVHFHFADDNTEAIQEEIPFNLHPTVCMPCSGFDFKKATISMLATQSKYMKSWVRFNYSIEPNPKLIEAYKSLVSFMRKLINRWE
jgi:hypothetical protein